MIFSSLGFVTQEKILNGNAVVDAVLMPDNKVLSEVVVTGYATQKRRDVTGWMTYRKNASGLTDGGLAEQLNGKVAGIKVTTTNGNGFYSPAPNGYFDGESYEVINENKFLSVSNEPLSTFSIDVDAAGYSNVRRFLNNGQLPPANAVRIEEMVNYFKYEYPQPTGKDPFSINTGNIVPLGIRTIS